MPNKYTETGKKNKLNYISKYNKGHYCSINITFRKDDKEDVAIHQFLQSQPSTNKYLKELVKKEMLKLGIPLEVQIAMTDDQIENLSIEEADNLIETYFSMFGEMPSVMYPQSVYEPMYIKLIIRSINNNKPYRDEDILVYKDTII